MEVYQLTSNASGDHRILGSLRSVSVQGVVRMEDRFETGSEDLWSAIAHPHRLARRFGELAGDLRLGG